MENLYNTVMNITYKSEEEKLDYQKEIYDKIDQMILHGAKHEGITSIYFSQLGQYSNIFEVYYRKENTPALGQNNKIASGNYPELLILDNHLMTLEDIVKHYRKKRILNRYEIYRYTSLYLISLYY